MKRRQLSVRLTVPALLVLLLASTVAVVAEAPYQGAEVCAACHEDVVASLELSPHAVAPGWDAEAGCESCHGDGTAHVESGGEPSNIVNVGKLSPREVSETCMTCHSRQASHFSSRQSIHRLADVGCTDCHDPHSTADKMIDGSTTAVCSSCHMSIADQFKMPRSHPLDESGDGCVSCHNPHGTKSLRTTVPLFDQTCSNCHFEKSGPFLFAHDTTIIDGCAGCHEVHGSPNRHLLKHEPQVNLCYQCHSASVTPTWHSVPRFLNEKCTVCHTAIHGSNTSPFFLEE